MSILYGRITQLRLPGAVAFEQVAALDAHIHDMSHERETA